MGIRQARPELLALTGQAGTIEASASPISRARGVVEGLDATGIADHGHSPSLTASVKISSILADVSVRPLRYLPAPLGSGRSRKPADTAKASWITSLAERCSLAASF